MTPAASCPVTPAVLEYLKGLFPPALIDGMVRDGEYVIVDEENMRGQTHGSNSSKN